MKIKKERTLKRGRIITLFTAVVLFAGCFKEVSYRTDYVLKPLVQENSGDVAQLLPEGKAQAFAHAADTVFWEVASYEDALAGIITRRDNPTEKQTVPLVTAEPYQQEGIAGWLSMRIDKPSVMVVAVDTEHRIYGYTQQEIAENFPKLYVSVVFKMRYLNQAKAVWDYLSQYGWDNTCGGGVHWKELNEPSKSKHTCSTAPTGVLSCKLYQLTHEQKYLDKAIECFNWLQAYMQDPSDHLYYDNVSPDPEDPTQPGRMETNKYSYNSGQPLQLACLLYKITKNESYLTAAHQIAEACHKKWFTSYHSEVLQRDFNILAPGHAWFNTVMCRGFFELYSIDKNPSYLEDVRNTMLHAWFGKAHHISGLINDEDLSGAVSMNKWEILRQASLVELYALLAIWESGKDQTVLL